MGSGVTDPGYNGEIGGRLRRRLRITRRGKSSVVVVADQGNADYLVTGDDDLLAIKDFKPCPIITPEEFRQGRISLLTGDADVGQAPLPVRCEC